MRSPWAWLTVDVPDRNALALGWAVVVGLLAVIVFAGIAYDNRRR